MPIFNKFTEDQYQEVLKLIKDGSTDKNILNEILIDIETNTVEVTKGSSENVFKKWLNENYYGWHLAKIIK